MQGHLRVALQSEQTSQNCWKTSTAKQWSSLRIRTGRTEPSRLGLTLERVFPEDAVFSSTGFPGPSPPAISHAGGAGVYIPPSVPGPVMPAVFSDTTFGEGPMPVHERNPLVSQKTRYSRGEDLHQSQDRSYF